MVSCLFFIFCIFNGLDLVEDGLKVIKQEGLRVIWYGENHIPVNDSIEREGDGL